MRFHIAIYFGALALFFMTATELWGQSQTSRGECFTIYDGLSSNKVTCLYRDSRGYLWIGTEDGLNRYDGYGFVVYRHAFGDANSISDNFIQAIYESSNGDVFIGTRYGGLNVWKRKDDRFLRFQKVPGNTNSLPENEICGILEIKDNSLWVKTRNYLANISLSDGRVNAYGHFSNIFKSDDAVSYPLVQTSGGKILLGTKDGLNLFDPSNFSFTRIKNSLTTTDFHQGAISDIIPAGSGFFVASDGQVMLFNEKQQLLTLVSEPAKNNNWHGNLKLLKSGNGAVWIGASDGLFKVGLRNGELEKQFAGVLPEKVLGDNITSLVEDESGILWVGTRHSGVLKLDFKPARFQTLGSDQSGAGNVSSLCFQASSKVWAGSVEHGLRVFDTTTGTAVPVNIWDEGTDARNGEVTALFASNDNNVWIGTNRGVYRYLTDEKRVVEFDYCGNREFETLLRQNEVRAITQDLSGDMWFAAKFGLYKYTGHQIESFFCDAGNPNSLNHDETTCLLVDNDNVLWVGTRNGINLYGLSGKGFQRFLHNDATVNVLLGDYILSMAQDNSGNIWIGTRKGLAKYNKTTHACKIYTMADGLASDVMNGILCDRLDRVWVSTNRGISCIINDLVLNFSTEDGLAGYVFSPGAVCKSSSGELYFGGFKGINCLSPGVIDLNKHLPKVVIQKAQVFQHGEPVIVKSGELSEVEYKYARNSSLRIDFSALEFSQPHQNRYKVMLEGFDEDWCAPSAENFVVYSNLSPGTYKLKVMGANNDLVWSDEVAVMTVRITPPLYRSVYAIIFYLVAAFLLVQAIVNYRVRHYRKAYLSLKEKAVDKKRIEAQREALSRINRSLTDSINYAKRIQEAMLFSEEAIKRLLSDSFIYFRPKDIVSGDFYYFHVRDNKLFVAAVDCTGHGVPGAFMSIIGYDLMRNIIEIQGIDCPASVLEMMNDQLLAMFNDDNRGSESKNMEMNDGMDMALCVVDYSKRIIEFAGANNSLYLVRDNELETYDGNRMAIGSVESHGKFTKQQFVLYENDIIYMFSDGYADQFGGPEGKKFKYRRFRHLLLNIHKMPLEDQKAILHQKMEEWMGESYEQVDDMLLMGIKPLSNTLL